MPVVTIQMWEGRTKQMKGKLIKSVSNAVADSLGIPIDRVEVVLQEVSKDNWGKGGEQASGMRKD
ncbi:MAG TPA: 2-hydroxymuconate tautomerase [Candidatus Nanoarchaeia archaeon]|nr:2-hydroxymuconate tautomerase [Candidatus Nanoarchaeia archaeon]